MMNHTHLPSDLQCPISVTATEMGKYFGADIIKSKLGFQSLGRVPVHGEFGKGRMFDAGGVMYHYDGDEGFPRYSRSTKAIAEALIVPAMVSKLISAFVYFGPRITASEQVSLEVFKREILISWEPFSGRDHDELSGMVTVESDFRSVIMAIEKWRYFGGKRDADGHPIGD